MRVGSIANTQVQLVGMEAALLAHALLGLQHGGTHVALIRAQLELLHAGSTAETSGPARAISAGLLAGQAQWIPSRIQSLHVARRPSRAPCVSRTELCLPADTQAEERTQTTQSVIHA